VDNKSEIRKITQDMYNKLSESPKTSVDGSKPSEEEVINRMRNYWIEMKLKGEN